MRLSIPNLTLVLTLLSLAAVAQVNVTGKVVDEAGAAIAGANVLIKDTYDGASTDAQGSFAFPTAEAGRQVLVVTSIAYDAVEIEIDLLADVNITVKMKEAFNDWRLLSFQRDRLLQVRISAERY